MDTRIEAFLHYMSAERGASKNTIDAYRNDLTRFAEFAGERGGNVGDALVQHGAFLSGSSEFLGYVVVETGCAARRDRLIR